MKMGDEELSIKKAARSYRYLIWLVSDNPQKTTVQYVKINNFAVSFDTAHHRGPLEIFDDIKQPWGADNNKIVKNKNATYIRIYLKGYMPAEENKAECLTIRFKEGKACSEKIKKSIEMLPAKLTE